MKPILYYSDFALCALREAKKTVKIFFSRFRFRYTGWAFASVHATKEMLSVRRFSPNNIEPNREKPWYMVFSTHPYLLKVIMIV